MTHSIRRILVTLVAVAGATLLGVASGHAETAQIFQRGADAAEAPFGGAVSPIIINYNRAAPYVGTAGLLGEGGVAEAAQLGFKTIIDLRSPAEPNQPAEAYGSHGRSDGLSHPSALCFCKPRRRTVDSLPCLQRRPR